MYEGFSKKILWMETKDGVLSLSTPNILDLQNNAHWEQWYTGKCEGISSIMLDWGAAASLTWRSELQSDLEDTAESS